MGWSRDSSPRIYRDKDRRSYFIWEPDSGSATANALSGPEPSLCGCSVPRSYISVNWLKRVAWDELPAEWRTAFIAYGYGPDESRGFHRIRRGRRCKTS